MDTSLLVHVVLVWVSAVGMLIVLVIHLARARTMFLEKEVFPEPKALSRIAGVVIDEGVARGRGIFDEEIRPRARRMFFRSVKIAYRIISAVHARFERLHDFIRGREMLEHKSGISVYLKAIKLHQRDEVASATAQERIQLAD